jgi:DNA primase large subunit
MGLDALVARLQANRAKRTGKRAIHAHTRGTAGETTESEARTAAHFASDERLEYLLRAALSRGDTLRAKIYRAEIRLREMRVRKSRKGLAGVTGY